MTLAHSSLNARRRAASESPACQVDDTGTVPVRDAPGKQRGLTAAGGGHAGVPRRRSVGETEFRAALPELVVNAFADPNGRTNPRMPMLRELEGLLRAASAFPAGAPVAQDTQPA
jgi:hypothetical protein